jgi:hypothetical protein
MSSSPDLHSLRLGRAAFSPRAAVFKPTFEETQVVEVGHGSNHS